MQLSLRPLCRGLRQGQAALQQQWRVFSRFSAQRSSGHPPGSRSGPALPAAAAAAEARGAEARGPLPPAEGAASGVHARFAALWRSLLRQLFAAGHYAADAGRVGPEQLDVDKGASKRAVLSFARQRPDLRYSLPEDQLRALVQAGFPRPDRKVGRAAGWLVARWAGGCSGGARWGGPLPACSV